MAYFCEVAASFDLARGGSNGHPVVPGWWDQHLRAFKDQVAHFCPGCGVPAKQKPSQDNEEIDTYTISNDDIAMKDPKRKVRHLPHDESEGRTVTRYGNLT